MSASERGHFQIVIFLTIGGLIAAAMSFALRGQGTVVVLGALVVSYILGWALTVAFYAVIQRDTHLHARRRPWTKK